MNHANQREILGCRNTIIIEPVGIQVHPAELENFTHMLIYKIYKGNNNTTKKMGLAVWLERQSSHVAF